LGKGGRQLYCNDYSASSAATSSAIVVVDSLCHGVGINNISATEVSVYPNPASNVLNVTSNENMTGFNLEMYDVVGRVVISQILEGNSNAINIAKLANGTYVYKITDKTDGVVAQSKFTVIK
jgi:hypothetical protein